MKQVKPRIDRKITKLLTFHNVTCFRHYKILAKTRTRMTTTITFSCQNDAEHYLVLRKFRTRRFSSKNPRLFTIWTPATDYSCAKRLFRGRNKKWQQNYDCPKGFSFIVCLTIVTLMFIATFRLHTAGLHQDILSIYWVELLVPPWLLVIGVSQTSLMVGGFRSKALLALWEEEADPLAFQRGRGQLTCCLIVDIQASGIWIPLYVPVDVVRVKSHVDRLHIREYHAVRVSVNKLNFVPERIMPGLIDQRGQWGLC